MAPAVDYNETNRTTTKGLATNEQPLKYIMAGHGEKVRRTGWISGTSAKGLDTTT